MPEQTFSITLTDANETAQRAVALGAALHAGDVVLLSGPVGAGKTHFARALIQSQLTIGEDVPSPTFTLVQTYDSNLGEIWHADLYRLTSTHEIEELGLSDAFETAVCLVEWPDRLGPLAPDHALTLDLADGAESGARTLTASWRHEKWDAKLAAWRV